ncbi:MAG: hypothetical protein KDK56_07425 [Simkania sp.]|nr:hypothetical protein [Simkania sp.]MCP5491121.1 hypothetical protein [Chlamydiales bacterium]
MSEFYISIIAASRNDDHGGRLLERMQAFIDGVIAQSKRHRLPVELIIVEWNPPEDRPYLNEVLKVPTDKGGSAVRIIRVSKKLHDALDHSNNLPLFQMYAKNIGIRRARGDYVIATNIDIIFSDELFSYLKKRKLKPGVIYRVDRLDIPSDLPEEEPFENVLEFCHGKFFRINGRFGTKILDEKTKKFKHTVLKKFLNIFDDFKRRLKRVPKLFRKLKSKNVSDWDRWKTLIIHVLKLFRDTFREIQIIRPFRFRIVIKKIFLKRSMLNYCLIPHSNGCGDFNLISRKGWEALRGYPEWTIFSWHIDSVFLYQAIFSEFKERNFGQARPIYHIEHGKGSGYTPEGFQALLNRLDEKKIPYLDMPAFKQHLTAMKTAKEFSKTLLYNNEDWGMLHEDLEEVFM